MKSLSMFIMLSIGLTSYSAVIMDLQVKDGKIIDTVKKNKIALEKIKPEIVKAEPEGTQAIVLKKGGFIKVTGYGLSKFAKNKPFTFEAWVKPESVESDQQIIHRLLYWGKGGYAYGNICLGIAKKKAYASILIKKGGKRVTNLTLRGGVIFPDQWVHLALSFDGENLKLFVNGQGVITKKMPKGASYMPRARKIATSRTILVGNSCYTGGHHFTNGVVGRIRIKDDIDTQFFYDDMYKKVIEVQEDE